MSPISSSRERCSASGKIAIRLALGASRRRLARLLLADSAVLGVLGGVAALFITLWVGPVLSASLLSDSATTGLDTRVLLFAAVAVLVTVVLAGFAPAYSWARSRSRSSC